MEPKPVRFFAVGEYGDESERPHYHLALFGYPGCRYGMSQYSKTKTSCCTSCDVLRRSWGLGNTFVGTLDDASIKYVAGYTVKKMNAKSVHLQGRHPEFARMSLNPGIGYPGLRLMADRVTQYKYVDKFGDVPFFLGQGRGKLPLARYLRRKLRVMCGFGEDTPEAVILAWQAELQALSGTAEVMASKVPYEVKANALKNGLIEYGAQTAANMKGREAIFKQRRTL